MGIGEDQYIIRQYSQTSVVIAETLILVCCDKGLLNISLTQDWLWKLVFTHSKENSQTGVAWCIWGPKAKINYLVLDIKLLLININYVKNFLFLEIL